jgi:hypothetical protein
MNDTSPETQNKLNEIYNNKSGEERLLIALKMFETARNIVLSSLPEHLSNKDLRSELFLRFYGNSQQIINLLSFIDYLTIFSNLKISSLNEAARSNSRSFAALRICSRNCSIRSSFCSLFIYFNIGSATFANP